MADGIPVIGNLFGNDLLGSGSESDRAGLQSIQQAQARRREAEQAARDAERERRQEERERRREARENSLLIDRNDPRQAAQDATQRAFAYGVQERLRARGYDFDSDPSTLTAEMKTRRRAEIARAANEFLNANPQYVGFDPRRRELTRRVLGYDSLINKMTGDEFVPYSAEEFAAPPVPTTPNARDAYDAAAADVFRRSGRAVNAPAPRNPLAAPATLSAPGQDTNIVMATGTSLIAGTVDMVGAGVSFVGETYDSAKRYFRTRDARSQAGEVYAARNSAALRRATRGEITYKEYEAERQRAWADREKALAGIRANDLANNPDSAVNTVANEIDETLTGWTNSIRERDFPARTKQAQRDMSAAVNDGRWGDALGHFFNDPTTSAVNIAGLVGNIVGSGGVGAGAVVGAGRAAAAVGLGVGVSRAAVVRGAAAGFVSTQAEAGANEVEATLRSAPIDAMRETPLFRRIKGQLPDGTPDAVVKEYLIKSQRDTAFNIGAAASVIGLALGPASEFGAAQIASTLFRRGAVLGAARATGGATGGVVARNVLVGVGREAAGEGIEAAGQQLANITGTTGRGVGTGDALTDADITRIGSAAAFEGTLGGLIGGTLSLGQRFAAGRATPQEMADTEARLADELGEQLVPSSGDPDIDRERGEQAIRVAETLTRIDDAVEGSIEDAIGDERGSQPTRDSVRASARRIEQDALDADSTGTGGFDALKNPPPHIRKASERLVESGGDIMSGLTPVEMEALDEEHDATETGAPTITDDAVADTRVAVTTADAVVSLLKKAFVTGQESPGKAGEARVVTPNPQGQIDALIPALQETGLLGGRVVSAAQALVASGLGGPRGGTKNAMAVARAVERADPTLTGIVAAMGAVTHKLDSVRNARNALRNAISKAPKEPVVPVEQSLPALRDALKSAGAPAIAALQKRAGVVKSDATGGGMMERIRNSVVVPPRGKARGKLAKVLLGETNVLTQQGALNAARREVERGNTTQSVVYNYGSIPFVSSVMTQLHRLRESFSDRSTIQTYQQFAVDQNSDVPSRLQLSSRDANLMEESSKQRIKVDQMRSNFMHTTYRGVHEASANASKAIAQDLNVSLEAADDMRELYTILHGAAGRTRKKLFAQTHLLTDENRNIVNDYSVRLAAGEISPADYAARVTAIMDRFDAYTELPPGVKDPSTVDIEQDDTVELPNSVYEQLQIDVTTSGIAAKNQTRFLTTVQGAQAEIDSLAEALTPESLAVLNDYRDSLTSAYRELFDMQYENGYVTGAVHRFMQATGINENYVPFARVQEESDTNTDIIEDEPVNFANARLRSWAGDVNVSPLANLNDTLLRRAVGTMYRISENDVLKTALRTNVMATANGKGFADVARARDALIDPKTGNWIYPDQPSTKDQNIFLIREGDVVWKMVVKDPKMAEQLGTAVVSKGNWEPESAIGKAVYREVTALTAGVSRLMLMSVPYVRAAFFRDLIDNVDRALGATSSLPVAKRGITVGMAAGQALMASPTMFKYNFMTTEKRAAFVNRLRESKKATDQILVAMHDANVLPDHAPEIIDGVSDDRSQIGNFVLGGGQSNRRAVVTFANRILSMSDILTRVIPYVAAREVGMSQTKAVAFTRDQLERYAAAEARAVLDMTNRTDWNPAVMGMVRTVSVFANSQMAGTESNLRNIWKDGRPPFEETVGEDGTITRTLASPRKILEATDWSKIAFFAATGYATTTLQIAALLGESDDDENEQDLATRFNINQLVRANPIANLIGAATTSSGDRDGDGTSDAATGFYAPSGYAPGSFFNKLGAGMAVIMAGGDAGEVLMTLTKAFTDSFTPVSTEFLTGDISNEDTAFKPESFIRGIAGFIAGPVLGYTVNTDGRGLPIYDEAPGERERLFFPEADANTEGRELPTPSVYEWLPGNGEGARYFLTSYLGGPMQWLDGFISDIETAAKYPELAPVLSRQWSRMSGSLSDSGRHSREFSRVMDGFYGETGRTLRELQEADAKAAGKPVSYDVRGPQTVAWINANKEAYEAYLLVRKYNATNTKLKLDAFQQKDAGAMEMMGDIQQDMSRRRVALLKTLRKDYPFTLGE